MAPKHRIRTVILGAAGRDFHNFNLVYRGDAGTEVVAFTATQIPGIANRRYPAALAGPLYPAGIPIVAESGLGALLRDTQAERVVFAYSDVTHQQVMHLASRALAAGADFVLLGPERTMIQASVPVIAVSAVRTGCGKSQTVRYLSGRLRELTLRAAIIRHPMPYGDLRKQICQRFGTYADFEKYKCTIEEREEYEPWVEQGMVIYAGVDYEKILRQAEKEADVIIWDGGNNDVPFYIPDLHIVLADPHRPGHEISYYPGAVNIRMADVIILSKCNTATKENIALVEKNVQQANPHAIIIYGSLEIVPEHPERIKDKRVLAVEDGPTLTHGGMKYGAATLAAQQCGAKELVDPRVFAVGKLKDTFKNYPEIGIVLPAMGYSKQQISDLQTTINKVPCDLVIDGSPVNLQKLVKINKPWITVEYIYQDMGKVKLADVLKKVKV